jgi:SAM-dependent methyltransferase
MTEEQDTWETAMSNAKESNQQNHSPVERLVTNVAYYLRWKGLKPQDLKIFEVGCGFCPNLIHFAKLGMKVSGVDFSPTTIETSKKTFEGLGLSDNVELLTEGDFTDEKVEIPENHYDIVIESNVISFIKNEGILKAFDRIHRMLKPGGAFIGRVYRGENYTIFEDNPKGFRKEGFTMYFDNPKKGGYNLMDVGFAHFFAEDDLKKFLSKFGTVDLPILEYEIPFFEAKKRGFDKYRLSFFCIVAIK